MMRMYFSNLKSFYAKTLVSVTLLFIGMSANAQLYLPECTNDVPLLIIDLSASPDSTYITPTITRVGSCCGAANQINFISFFATLHPNAAMVEIGIAEGADPSGSGEYHFIDGGDTLILGSCVAPIAAGQPVCIPPGIVGPDYKIAFGKPGNNANKFFFRQILKPTFPEDDTTRVGCGLPFNIYGLDNIVINSINSSTGNTTVGAYNSLLDMTNPAAPIFSPGAATPAWIDYEICGTQQASTACGIYTSCDTVRLYTLDALELFATPNPATFCATSGGVLLTASAAGGDGNYSYIWTNSIGDTLSTADTLYATSQDDYTVELTDGLTTSTCPPESMTIPVTLGGDLVISAGPDKTKCASDPVAFLAGSVNGDDDGGTWSGGLGTYTPTPNDLLITYTPTAAEINAGSVTLYLTSNDNDGVCWLDDKDLDTVVIYYTDSVYVNPSYTAVVCNGDFTTVDANASNGTAPYTYAWTTGSIGSSIIAPSGTYGVTVTDDQGCTANANVTVSEPPALQLSLSSTNTSTDIACDGTATVVILGGVAPYSVLWDDLQTTLTATGYCYGVHSVTVTDANGCSVTSSVVVNNPSCSAFNVTATNTDVSCYGDTDAQAFSTPTGGTPVYTYSWNTTPVQNTQNATGLGAGTYTVTVTDALGCVDVANVTVHQPTIITNTMTHIDATSIGGTEGEATANPLGGTPGYTYLWNPSSQTTQTATGLSAGVYYVNIQDSKNCLKVDSVQINEPPCNDFTVAVNPKDITCNGANDGTAYIVIAQGTAPYSISWSSGETDVTSVTGLAAGSYTVTVTDASNCTTFETFDITEPDVLSIGLVPTNITCFGDNDGTIDLTVTGGTYPYSFSWETGGLPFATTQDLVNLKPGTYSISVVDANGCEIQGSVGITQPPKLYGTQVSTDITCNGDGNGAVDASVFGGTLPYSYSWTGPSGYTNNTQDISGLELGLYELMVTDGNGCKFKVPVQGYVNEPDTVLIQSYTIPCPAPGADNVVVTIDSISGGSWGSYDVSYDGGTFFGSTGDYDSLLAINTSYDLIARDSNGCLTPTPITIDLDPKVEITAVDFNPCIAVGTTDINITVTPIGGDGGPYEVSTDGGATFGAAGTYTYLLPVGTSYNIVIRDTKGCESVVWPIVIPEPFDANAVLTNEVTCLGDNDGSVDLTITGGTTPYTIAWTGPSGFTSASEDISGLFAGTYDVTITDDSSCVVNTSIVVTTVVDITNPVIACPVTNQTVVVDPAACTFQQAGTGWDATATDNCLVSTIEYSLTGVTTGTGTSLAGVSFNLGLTTVTWTATDNSGNTDVCSYTVTVQDDQLPAISNCGSLPNQNIVADPGVCTYTLSGTGWDATATDNCTVSSLTYTLTGATTGSGTSLDGVVFGLGTTNVVWTVTDNSGNSSTCSYTVDVTDDQQPGISSCGAAGTQTVNADAGVCTYTQVGTGWDATATDNCSVSTIIYTLSGVTSGTGTSLDGVVFQPGTTTVLWTVTDGSGNTSTCTFDVDVIDNEDPSITSCGVVSSVNVNADFGVCTHIHTGIAWDATATDNCGVASITYALTGATLGTGTTLNGVVFNLGTTTVTWTATDGAGNTDVCTFDVIVSDTQDPVISSCGGIGTETVNADLGVCTYTNSGTGWDVVVTDNCSIASSTYTLTGATTGSGTTLDGVAFNLGTTTVTWTVTDGSSNTSTCTYDVEVIDNQDPAITTCGPGSDQSVLADAGVCYYTNTGTGWDAIATDNCSVSTITYSLSGVTTGTGTSLDGVTFNLGTTIVTWTVADGSGNDITCSFNVTVSDNQNPSILTCGTGSNQSVVADGGVCYYTHTGTAWDATADDNCSVSSITYTLSGVTSGSGTSLDGETFNLGTTTVLWTATDASGNTSTCSFDVVVSDDQLPAITNCGPSGDQTVTANLGTCTYTYSGTGWNATATDNCSVSSIVYTLTGATTGSGTTLNGVSFNLGTTLVTWTVTDGSGNTFTCSFNVTVVDDQLPAISSCGAVGTQNVSTDAGVCNYTHVGTGWDATATDNCSISTLQYTLSGATIGAGSSLDGVTFAQGTTTVLWTVIDGSGNTSTCTFNVIVSDNEVPAIAGCISDITVNNDNGSCGTIVTWTPPTFTDNCGATMTSNYTPGDFFPIGTTTVTYTVTDNANNVSTCSFDVIVTDSELPQMTCQADHISCDSLVTFATPVATDNCGVVSVTQTAGLASGSFFPIGTTVVTFEALDVNGNISTCSFNVTINPTPVLSTTSTDVTCFGDGDGSIDLTVSNGTVPYSFSWSNGATSEDLSALQPGTYNVTVTDVNGCSVSTSETIAEPTQLTLNKSVAQVSCNGGNDGAINLTISGGTLPYTYAWSNSATTEDLSSLTAGTYSVTVTDGNGCTVTDNTTITEPTAIAIQSVVVDATCNAANGSISVLVTGGTTPYNYAWSNGATTANLTNVIGGNYTLTVTDDNGCIATLTDSVGTTSNISATVYPTDVSCYGFDNGSALAIVETGNAPYNFDWSTGETSNQIDDLAAGSYSVTITDFFGCEISIDFDIFQPDSLTLDLDSYELLPGYNVSENGASDGSIVTTVTGGVEPYSYVWSTGATTADLYNLSAGNYHVTVTDENGCVISGTIRLLEPGVLEMPEGVSPNSDGDNDYFVIHGLEAYPDNDITIYNRWGNIVYEQSGYQNDWYGQNNKSEPLPDGTYYVILNAYSSGDTQTLTGYIDLRRNR